MTEGRKSRDKQQREDLIVNSARKMLLKKGYQGLRLDDLAKEIEYSKGTLYQHFSNKEDLMLAVCTKNVSVRASLFEKVSLFQGLSREKMCAIGVVDQYFATNHPEHFDLDQMLKANSFWDKTSESRKQSHIQMGHKCFGVMLSIVEEAKRLQDLPKSAKANEIAFALISMTLGSHITTRHPGMCEVAKIKPSFQTFKKHQHALLDGYQWKPLFNEHDWDQTYATILNSLSFKKDLLL